MSRLLSIAFVVTGVIALVSVRVIEEYLFYDPLNAYYHGDFKNTPLPDLKLGLYALNLSARYLLNTIISLCIIYALFKNVKHIKLALTVFIAVGGILLAILMVQLGLIDQPSKQAIFYVRRLLMHPMLLFVLAPALYFQDLASKNKQ